MVALGVMATGRLGAETPGAELLGSPAPELHAELWINSEPLSLDDLRGRVVLVRFWTAPGCPFCSATAPSLNTLHERYGDDGLVVLGLYHHKARSPLDPADVARYAEGFGFDFPVAVDTGWRTLRSWWLDRRDRGWTSVSFLLDREGVVRWVHPGGKYVEGDEDFAELEAALGELLAR
ncbi:MAG: peroxiredoxin family protein [Thermoanaerobaculia bacterium]